MESKEQHPKKFKHKLLEDFLEGLVKSLGSWAGTTIVVGILLFVVSKVDFVPVVGNFIAHLIKYIQGVMNPFNI